MPNPHVITVYGLPDEQCFACKKTKELLTAKGATFEFVDLSDPEKKADVEAIRSLGHLRAPYVATSDDDWSGLNPDKIDDAAAKQQRSKLAAVA